MLNALKTAFTQYADTHSCA